MYTRYHIGLSSAQGHQEVRRPPAEVGAGAAAADVVTYSKSKGAFVGVVLDGAVVSSRDGWNTAYYGEGTTPWTSFKGNE